MTEFDGRDETLDESIELVRRLKNLGLDLIDVSIGFSIPDAKIPWGPAFMAPITERVRREAGISIRDGKVDLVMLGRPLLENPHWPYDAARALGITKPA